MQIIRFPERHTWAEILQRPTFDHTALEAQVGEMLNDIKANGDAAVKKYAEQFDKVQLDTLEVPYSELRDAAEQISEELKAAIKQAKQNIELFHARQITQENIVQTMPGVQCWRKVVPIEKVGLYIPGGTAPLFSTILMLAVPAKIAACKEIVLCTPTGKDGKIPPVVLYTAFITGITKVFKIGGVQAIGAMAYGTASVPQVYKIFGPGNQYVTCAKQLVNKAGVAIDMPAGPSEVAVFADESCVPGYVAADLLSQCEHGTDSQAVLVTTSEEVLVAVESAVLEQLEQLPRKDIAAESLKNSKLILIENKRVAMDMLNEYAPEHLIIACSNDTELADQVINAGSVFLGNYSPESAGDYASGTNHTLPTNGHAKAYSGVSYDSFVKKITYQRLSQSGLQNLAQTIEVMAAAEGLDAHKNAVSIRIQNK
ncbi:histidinol dehydrogenase [Chitinophaga skermanii]|uniref:Histidinol dehydrogenase n=1 Tax=Chitinophaga skermanii TaxID=331697 RepID=A0A327QFI5_9BACT|nr:histidinol dehydrogenase [Chitinophaga skermanii]RAJ02648.1 histidinol dehydrogenase [Chitinophaga skermanii]